MKKILFLLIVILVQQLNAQTPLVKTLSPHSLYLGGWLTYTENIFRGSINPQGGTYTIYFEFGTDEHYGSTAAASITSVSGTNDIEVNTVSNPVGSIIAMWHYRLVAVNTAGEKFYGKDVVFHTTLLYHITRVEIEAVCYNNPYNAIFELRSLSPDPVTIDYIDNDTKGSVILYYGIISSIQLPKYSICTFLYNSKLIKDIGTNNQYCSEDPNPIFNIRCYAVGKLDGNNGQVFLIENRNTFDFPLQLTSGVTQISITIPINSRAEVITPQASLVLSYNNEQFMTVGMSYDFDYIKKSLIQVIPLNSDASNAAFELQNNDNIAHEFLLHNALGTDYTYSMAANSFQTITLPTSNYDLYINNGDLTPIIDYRAIGNHYFLYSVSPGTAALQVTPSVSLPTSVTSSSMTLNGKITSTIAREQQVPYHFAYGTDKNNLNLSTSVQTATAVEGPGTAISAALTGLTSGTTYYYQLVPDGGSSSVYSFLLDSPIPSSNLKLHLRADGGVISSSSAVSEWNDLSGNGNNATQSTSANQPALVSNSLNGNPVIRFDGTYSKLTLPTSATLAIQSNLYEMFMVAKSSSSNVQFLIAGGYENFEYHLNGDAGARFIPIASTWIDLGTAGSYTDGNAHIFSARASSSGGAVRVDGTDGGTSSANILSSNSGALQLGVRSDGTYYFNGDIAEVILYNTNLSASDRSTVEHYLANRYGITSGALPVELTSFTANFVDGKVSLNWQTATEVNNYGFEVERAANLRGLQNGNGNSNLGGFSTIGFVQGSGNSNSPKSYSFTDKPTSGTEFKYRLKQIDFDGKYEYSKELEVKVEAPAEFKLAQNYPNPFNPETVISYELPVNGKVELRVFDLLGREVAELVNEEKVAGRYETKFSAKDGESNFSSGVYYYQLRAGTFIDTKKFIMLK